MQQVLINMPLDKERRCKERERESEASSEMKKNEQNRSSHSLDVDE